MVGRSAHLLRRWSLAIVLVAGSFLVDPSAAFACSCMPQTKPQLADNASVIFTGTVTSVGAVYGWPAWACGPRSTAERATFGFDVETVFKGESSRSVTVTTAMSGASCGFEFVAGKRYTVFARSIDGRLETNLCNGNELGEIVAADYGLGAGRPPK